MLRPIGAEALSGALVYETVCRMLRIRLQSYIKNMGKSVTKVTIVRSRYNNNYKRSLSMARFIRWKDSRDMPR